VLTLTHTRKTVTDKIFVDLGWGDYGCYFYIENTTDTTLARERWDASWGEWVGEPPMYISSNKMSPEMHIKDKWGAYISNSETEDR